MPRGRFKPAAGLALAAWVIAVLLGHYSMSRYELTPGAAAAIKPHSALWPLICSGDRPTLLMLLHPLCPCSKASLEELADIVQSAHRPAKILLVFETYQNAPDPAGTPIWKQASAIPGAIAIQDTDGEIAARCGARTSGQIFVYDNDGALQFSGGITPSRGNVGDNPGRSSVQAVLAGHIPTQNNSPVFGCSLK